MTTKARHRFVTPWMEANCPDWKLTGVIPGPSTAQARADFFVYEQS